MSSGLLSISSCIGDPSTFNEPQEGRRGTGLLSRKGGHSKDASCTNYTRPDGVKMSSWAGTLVEDFRLPKSPMSLIIPNIIWYFHISSLKMFRGNFQWIKFQCQLILLRLEKNDWVVNQSLKGRSYSFKFRITYMFQLRSCHSWSLLLLYNNFTLCLMLFSSTFFRVQEM